MSLSPRIRSGSLYSLRFFLKVASALVGLFVSGLLTEARAQSFREVRWQATLGGSQNDIASTVAAMPDGGVAVAGVSQSADGDVRQNMGSNDLWVVRLDTTGRTRWSRTLGGSYNESIGGLAATPDGGLVVVGSTASEDGDIRNNLGNDDYWVVKLDGEGQISWTRTFGGKESEGASAVAVSARGEIFVAGSSASPDRPGGESKGDFDFWILKLSPSGQLLWSKGLGGSSNDGAKALALTPDGGVVAAGFSFSTDLQVENNHGGMDFWVAKLTGDGALTWTRTLGGSGPDMATGVAALTDGSVVVTGVTASGDGDVSGNHGSDDYWVVRLSPAGKMIWQRPLGSMRDDIANSITALPGDRILISGYTATGSNSPGKDAAASYWVNEISPDGYLMGAQTWIQRSLYSENALVALANGTICLAGSVRTSTATESGDLNYWVGVLPWSSFERPLWQVQVYPSPVVNQNVSVLVQMGKTDACQVQLLDVQGRRLLAQALTGAAGNFTGSIPMQDKPPGTYFLQISSDGQSVVKKIVKQ